jgi:uncharacterized protein YndB with AHSA1/START domain
MSDAHVPAGAHHGFTLTRVFDAPRQLVWDAITQPEQVGEWFGTREVKVDVAEYDARPGGAMRATMYWEGNEMPWAGEFKLVEPIERLALAIVDGPALTDQYELLTYTLADLGDGRTELTFTQHGHMTPEQYDAAKEGSVAFLDAMASVIAERKAAS